MLRDFFPEAENVVEITLVLTAPELGSVRDINQFGLHRVGVSTREDASDEDGTDPKVASDFPRILIAAFVAVNSRACHDPKLSQPREAINNLLSHAIA